MVRIQRRKNKKFHAILTADWHLRENTPLCRIDNFWSAQWKKVQYIKALQEEYNCIVLHAGDLFDMWKPSPYLLTATQENIPSQFYTIYGNHDLPQHNIDLAYKCGINTLISSGFVSCIDGGHWGRDLKNISFFDVLGKKVLVWHTMICKDSDLWPGCGAMQVDSVIRKFDTKVDLILTGHNHQRFTARGENCLLVNPGAITRQTVDQINFEPCVFLWNAEENLLRRVKLPIDDNVISREHIEKVQKRDSRIDAFVASINENWKAELSFEENLLRYQEQNKVRKSVMDIIWKAFER